jgi:hypothetical protein
MSIENRVEKSIKTFYSSMKENIDYVDLNFRGIVNRTRMFTDDKGNKQSYVEQTVGVEGVACLRDKFRIWLMSDDGDYHRNPGVGGFLVKNVVKRPFIDANCPVIEALLRAEAEEKFPQLELLDVKVTCDHTTRRWNIKISILDKKTGLIDNTMYVDGEAISVMSDA